MTRARMSVTVAVTIVVAAALGSFSPAAAADDRDPRLLIVSIPGATWVEIDNALMPSLGGFLEDAAVADLAPRSVRHSSRPGDAYLTIGGGTRAIGDPLVDGQQLAADADFAGEPAAGIFERRTGQRADGAIVSLGWAALQQANSDEDYDVVLGLLADTLHDADVSTSVIGNADGSDITSVSFERQAALALTGSAGRLDHGSVDTDLLVPDPAEPFGVRLDHARVLDAFDRAWSAPGPTTVLVEESDLARTLRYRSLIDAGRYFVLRAAALRRADELFGRLLERVDPERDAVLVVAPYLRQNRVGLTAVAYRGPGTEAGYLKSASTQRSGIVSLVDIAPTILDRFGISRPTEMEGRPFEIVPSQSSVLHRVKRLERINASSLFREQLLTPTTVVLVLALAGIVALAIVAFTGDRSRRWRRAVAFAALADLAALPASFAARAFPLEDLGASFYWPFLIVSSIALAAVATLIGRKVGKPVVSLGVVLGLGAALLVGDVMTGSNLHLGAAFGYSPTANSRLYGISNYSFGLLSVASCLLAAMIAHRWPDRRGRTAAIALMVFTLVVLGSPIWGSDVGGIIAFTPTILVFVGLLLRLRVSIRRVAIVGFATVMAVVVFGFVDLARPPEQRAHLGRLFERIGNEGLEPLVSIVERKLVANLSVSTSSFWMAAIPIGIGCWAFLRWWSTKPLARLHQQVPTLHAALAAGAVAAVLGSLVNDSGAIVGGVASLVLTTTLVFLTLELDPPGAVHREGPESR